MTVKKFESINVVPFIDIMLVLLVIVLTTATFVAQGIIPVDLPKSQAQNKEKPKEPLRITIKNDGAIFIEEEAMTLENLGNSLKNGDAKRPVEIRCDQQSAFKYFVSVIDLLKRYEYNNLGIATEHE